MSGCSCCRVASPVLVGEGSEDEGNEENNEDDSDKNEDEQQHDAESNADAYVDATSASTASKKKKKKSESKGKGTAAFVGLKDALTGNKDKAVDIEDDDNDSEDDASTSSRKRTITDALYRRILDDAKTNPFAERSAKLDRQAVAEMVECDLFSISFILVG